jgi:TolB-like protein
LESKKRYFFIFLCLFIVFLFFCNAASSEDQAKVLVLPLAIHSEKDLLFLRNGIEDMLSTRLAYIGKILLLSREESKEAVKDIPEPINEGEAVLLGQKYQADFVLFGSLTVFGESVSTDVRFIDVHQKKPLVIFNHAGKTHGDVITHVNLFADQVNQVLLGGGLDIDARQQREFAYQAPMIGQQRSGRSGYPGVTPERDEIFHSLWKTRKFKAQIRGIAVGDVDGDGSNETVFISDNKIFIYRYTGEKFDRIKEIQSTNQDSFLGVDIADINKNGNPEIFITSVLQSNRRLNSFVLEWKESTFKKISDGENWYYRVLHIPGRGSSLFGQKRGVKDFFAGDVYELEWSGGSYKPVKDQNLPKDLNIYNFTYGDVFNNGKEMITSYTTKNRIMVLGKDGEEEWISSESYGGNIIHLELPVRPGSSADAIEEMDRFYIPQRIQIADLDKDGKNEIVVVKNEDTASGLFARLRIFKTGHIEFLGWNGGGFVKEWKTQRFSRYISDCAVGDLNNDGEDELVFSVVSATDTAFADPRSYIISLVVNK